MNLLAELEAVLKAEQELLLSGDFAALPALVDRKTRLSEELAKQKPDVPPAACRDLIARARRNEVLLESSRRGLQAAMVQLRHSSGTAEQSTYSSSGKRQPLSRGSSTVTQKL